MKGNVSRSIQRQFAWCAGLFLLASACTTTYGPNNPPHDEAIDEPVCEEGSEDPDCVVDNPDCSDPSSYCAEPL
jgi:hypothetical protein